MNDRPLPALRPGYILVKVETVALNPTDWKHIEFHNIPGALCGCDYAGTVARTGSGYTKQWKRGDRICGITHGSNRSQAEDGAFAEYIVVKVGVQIKIPADGSFSRAATLGLGMITAGQGLYQAMQLSWPSSQEGNEHDHSSLGKYVLVYGGSPGSAPWHYFV